MVFFERSTRDGRAIDAQAGQAGLRAAGECGAVERFGVRFWRRWSCWCGGYDDSMILCRYMQPTTRAGVLGNR